MLPGCSYGPLGDILVTDSPDCIGHTIPAHHKSGILTGQGGINAHLIAAAGTRSEPLNTVGLCPCGFESRLRHEGDLQVIRALRSDF